jgi:UDP-glucose:(heptosyl)LPS alpha-1,3-glucosyltransferase
MKLAFCLFKYFPYGGLQRDFLRIAKACMARGHEVHVYTTQWDGELELGLHLHIIQAKGWQNHTRNQSFAERMWALVQAAHYDVIVGFNKMPHLDLYYAADVCYQARIHEQKGAFYRLLPRYKQQVADERAVFAQGQKTEILLISPLQQAAFVHYYQTEAARFHLLTPGIAKDRLAPANAADIRAKQRQSYAIPDDHFLLLMVGSGFKTKGLDRSLAALASLPAALRARCRLFVIGQDDPRKFSRLAKGLGIHHQLTFLGGRSDVPAFLLAADLLLQPSYHENTGTAILEAMASGLPVLTIDTCGYAHYVTEADAGCVLPSPFQQTAMNHALATMLTSPLREQWGRRALHFAKEADIYSLPEKAAALIEQKARDKHPLPSLSFDQWMTLSGECFREQKGRRTLRVNLGGKSYYIKQHSGVGWKEIIKNLVQWRLPVLGAKNEWLALTKLPSLGVSVPSVAAYGQRGWNPASQQSFVLMQDLAPAISLEDFCKTWPSLPPSFALKRQLIEEVARIAQVLHVHGMNHRDFYICHFLLDVNQMKLSLIDLHRAQIRRCTPKRWIIKDLAGLYFSSKDIGLTKRDIYRFMKRYRQQSLRDMLDVESAFWQKVKSRGEQLYRDHTK